MTYKKLISVPFRPVGRNLPYQYLGRNRTMAVSFRSKYRVIPGRTGRFGKNTGYRPENENRPVKCKPTKKKKRYPDLAAASTFLAATPLRRSFSTSSLSLTLCFFFFFIFRPNLLHFCFSSFTD